MLELIHPARGAAAPLAAVYGWQDYALAGFVLAALVFWLLIEFLGALRAAGRLWGRLTGAAPASAQEAAQRVSEASYAATRNDKQRRN